MNRMTLRLAYLFFDMLAAVIAWLFFVYFRQVINNVGLFEGIHILVPKYDYTKSFVLFPFCCLFVHYLSGVYLYPERHYQVRLFITTFVACAIIAVAIFFALLLDDIVVSYEYYYYSLLALFLILFVFTYTFRVIICFGVRRNYKTKRWTTRTAIIGTGKNAKKIAYELEKKLKENTFVGYISEDNKNLQQEEVIGRISQIEPVIKKENIQEIIIALDDSDEQRLFSIISSLYKYNISIRFTPGLYEILIGSVKMTELGMSPLVSITNPTMKDWQACVKRLFDIVASFLSLVILSPLFLFFAIRIKADSKGSVFFKQERIGQFGRPFDIVKFRTMYTNAENLGPQLSSPHDSRVTPFGRFLRKYRFDELPQFWNILKGEMSIVGPRPERDFYIKKITEVAPYYCLIYKIRPGLTSWGPIRIGYSDTLEKMVERLNYDVIYMEDMSLKTDLKILLYTVDVIFRGKGV
ncbi:sugar transferase [Paludibacter sp. 221]|uniref:sugar transferase n=1 Tax=Paludibacter sp. 221 TaxID=2302939 RepID=UPI0013D65D7B|nr:sugar transferase [Paludibacter sp. 221]